MWATLRVDRALSWMPTVVAPSTLIEVIVLLVVEALPLFLSVMATELPLTPATEPEAVALAGL